MCKCCGCRVTLCPLISAVSVLVLTFAGLVVPYYMTATTLTGSTVDGCIVLQYVSWMTIYCSASSQCGAFGPSFCPKGDSYDWQADWCSGKPNCANESPTLFNATAGALGVALICSIILVIGFSINHCKDSTRKLTIYGVVAGLMAIFILAATAGFAIYWPMAFTNDNPGCTTGTCSSFVGTNSTGTPGFTADQFWGPVGWIAPVLTLPLLAYVLYVSCKSMSDPVGDPLANNEI
jgi:hypothetical protein